MPLVLLWVKNDIFALIIPVHSWERLKDIQLRYGFIFILCSLAYFQDHSQTFNENTCVRPSEDGRIFSYFSRWQYCISNLQIYQKILNVLESRITILHWLVLSPK